MPVYEYECSDCKKLKSTLTVSFDVPAPLCESCNKPMKKVFSGSNTSFILKGKGWFKDGYQTTERQNN